MLTRLQNNVFELRGCILMTNDVYSKGIICNLHACLITHNNGPQNVYYVTCHRHCAQRRMQ